MWGSTATPLLTSHSSSLALLRHARCNGCCRWYSLYGLRHLYKTTKVHIISRQGGNAMKLCNLTWQASERASCLFPRSHF